MKLAKLEVQGYRSLRHIVWKPGDLNVLIGPNATGKTNLLRLLEFISMSAQGRMADHVQAEGGMQALYWDGRPGLLRMARETALRPGVPPFGTVRGKLEVISGHKYELLIEDPSNVPVSALLKLPVGWHSMPYVITRETLEHLLPPGAGTSQEPWYLLERNVAKSSIRGMHPETIIEVTEDVSAGETLLSHARPPFLLNPGISGFQVDLTDWTLFQDVWGSTYGREIGLRASFSIRHPVTTRHDWKVSPSGLNLVNVLHTLYSSDADFKEAVDAAMTAAFGNDFAQLEFIPAGEGLIQLAIRWSGLRKLRSAYDLSDGTLRYLFLITVLAQPKPPPLIAIEEPEIGLHPGMLPIVAEYAADAATRTQVVMTTHSPEFLDAFREPVVTATVFGRRDGETILAVLEPDKLRDWLHHYRLGEYLRTGEYDLWLKTGIEETAAP